MILARIFLILVLTLGSIGLEHIEAEDGAQELRALLMDDAAGIDAGDPSIADAEASTPAKRPSRPAASASDTHLTALPGFSSRWLSPPLKPPRRV